MSMLAEPKRRHKSFALQPRGKPLYEDSNNFGSKMLSKMGWEPGKGLGANENGKLDFIKVKYKNDIEGIGYEARDDQWTQHEDGFNKLLQSLSNSNSQENSDDDDARPMFGLAATESDTTNVKYKTSGESLEEKSKISRTRVHYKKFTKGKDLSQYSEKDLANIFGKKIDNGETFAQSPPLEDSTIAENKFVSSLLTTTSSVSLNDYFKQKMNKKYQAQTVEAEVEPEIEQPKQKKKKNKHKEEEQIQEVIDEVEEIVIEKKKKRKKKEFTQISPVEEETAIVVEIEKQTKKKNKRKEKVEDTIEIEIDDVPAKKSKKRKPQDVETEVVVKTKKKKNKSYLPEESSPMNIQPNSLKKSEIEFNRIRGEQICSYLRNCQRLMAQTTLKIHPVTAEIIRNANISDFKGANISQIIGYGLTPDVDIDVLKDIKVNLNQMLKETVTAENPHLIVFDT